MLDDKYRIERLLATGGMGAVYVGTHTKLHKRVAIKVLSPQYSSGPGIERFRREAVTASQIGHEGIAQVTDLGTSSEGEPFLVMEYLEGESLASRLRACGPLCIEDACEIACAILSPLGAAHRAGIVHRDLKPDNVFLVRQSRGETVKLLDFGISRVSGTQPEFRLTMTGLVLGTPFYMSPEQARGESTITTAADIYAFGVMLYEMLVGEVPIRADNYNQLMYRVTMSDFRPPRERRAVIPPELERTILHAMAQRPQERPSSTFELEQALLPFCRPMFREHATGRITAPALTLRSSGASERRSSGANLGASINYAMFEGSTLPDTARDFRPPADPVRPSGAGGIEIDIDEISAVAADPSSQPSLPAVAGDDDPIPTTIARPRHHGRLAAIAIATAGAAAVVAFVLVRADDRPPAVPPAARPVAIAPPIAVADHPAHVVDLVMDGSSAASGDGSAAPGGAGAAPDDAARQSPTITLRLAVEPSGAAISVDGERVTGTELVVRRDGAPHRLRITAAGYLEYDEMIRFDESQRLVVQLKRVVGMVRGKDRQNRKPERPGPERPERIESRSPYE